MTPAGRPRRTYTSGDSAVDRQLEGLFASITDTLDRRLLVELSSTIYKLAHEQAATGDLKLLNAAVKELRYAFKVFRPYRHIRKVATFGSSRVAARYPAYGMARAFGAAMAKAGWMVITGAASGIMKAGHEGAGRAASFGLNIRLPFEQEANLVIAKDPKLINCKYFFTRKLLFIKESHATALFPGGFGTLDEGFETLTLVQTGKSDPRPVVFVEPARGHFWRPLLRFVERGLVQQGMISPADRSIYQVVRSPEAAARAILDFYRVYHSMRYVGDRLVLRLTRAPSESQAASLSRRFRDLLSRGQLAVGGPLPEEADEPELAHLTRLVLPFNRRSYGRLVELIHHLNGLAG